MDSFLLVPEKYFWEKTEFFTDLKQSAVNDVYYESSKYLYQSLKIRNLGDKWFLQRTRCDFTMRNNWKWISNDAQQIQI